MKRLLAMILTASLMTAAAAAAVQAAEEQSQSDAIMAQMQSFKKANNEKTGGGETTPAEDKETIEQEEKAPAETKAPEEDEAQAQPQEQTQSQNPAAAAVDQIVKEESSKAAKESEAAHNNRGVVEIPPADAPEKTPEPQASPAPVQQPVEQPEAAPAEQPETEPQQAAPAAAQQPVAPVQQPAVSEIAQGRPLDPSPMDAGEAESAASLLVTVDWLKSNIKNVILVDSRPESLYLGGHIPGAVNAPWTYFANMNAKQGTEKWGVIWPPETMAKRIGALGINGQKTVIAYCDAGGWGQSGWTLWILRQAGIKNAKILLGGIGAWKEAGGELVKNKQTNKAVAFKITKYVPNYTVTTEWLNNNIGKPGLAIIDVRTEPEFFGKIRPFQEKRAGHLPGAINIPRESFITPEGHFKTVDEVKALLAPYGITPDTEIAVYDTAGVRSAFVTMLLRYAGYTKSQNYDEGFQAWAGNPDLPLVKP